MILLAEFQLSSWLPLLVMVPVTVFLMRRVYRRVEPRNRPVRSARQIEHQERVEATGTLGEESPVKLAQWEVKMYETERELSARLDNKMRSLNRFIELADAASDRLERLMAEAKCVSPNAVVDGGQSPKQS